jgi:cobalamin biosynthesis protein CobT
VKYDRDSAILEIGTIQKYIRTVADNAGLSAFFKEGIPTPYTDGKNLFFPKLNSSISTSDIKKLRHYVLHETSHHTKGPKAFEIANKAFPKGNANESPLFNIFNFIEDERIERAASQEYKGDTAILDEGWNEHYTEQLPEIEKFIKSDNDKAHRMTAAWYSQLKARSDWSPSASAAISQVDRLMGPSLKKYIDKVESSGLIEDIRDMSLDKDGSQQAFDLSKKLYELLFEESADEHIKNVNKGKPEPQPGNGEQGEGDGSGDGSGAEGEADGEGDGKPCTKPTGDKVDFKVFNTSKPQTNNGPGGTGIHLDYTKYLKERSSHHHPAFEPNLQPKVRNYRPGRKSDQELLSQEARYGGNGRHGTYESIMNHRASHGEPGKGFGNKVRQLLQIRSQSKYIGGQKKGKLHLKNMYRGAMPIDSYNERIFRTKHTSDVLDTCVTVLTDLSGSMNGTKVIHAIESSALLNDSISRSLRIPVELLGFTDTFQSSVIAIIKEFDQQLGTDDVLKNFSKATTFMNANADGEAIQYAYDRIRGRKEKRKILIVISDGSPACSRGGDIYAYTEKVIRQIEGEGAVEIYAVGIVDDTVKQLYKSSVVIKRADELESAILNLIKKSILR